MRDTLKIVVIDEKQNPPEIKIFDKPTNSKIRVINSTARFPILKKRGLKLLAIRRGKKLLGYKIGVEKFGRREIEKSIPNIPLKHAMLVDEEERVRLIGPKCEQGWV